MMCLIILVGFLFSAPAFQIWSLMSNRTFGKILLSHFGLVKWNEKSVIAPGKCGGYFLDIYYRQNEFIKKIISRLNDQANNYFLQSVSETSKTLQCLQMCARVCEDCMNWDKDVNKSVLNFCSEWIADDAVCSVDFNPVLPVNYHSFNLLKTEILSFKTLN